MGNKGQKTSAQQVGGTLTGIIKDRQWDRMVDQYRVFADWRHLVDQDTADHSRPLKVSKDVLVLEVDNSAWMQQLRFQKLFLLETLNRYLKLSHYKDIRFVLRGSDSIVQQEVPKPRQAPSVRFIPPPADQVAAFKEQISFIEDEDIRESLLHFWYLAHACRREE